MSQAQYSGSKGFVANTTTARGVLVKLSSGKVVVATAGTDKIIGVTEDSAVANETVSVRLRSASGTFVVQAGGTVAIGDLLTATTAGKAIATTTAGDQVVGMAIEAGASGDFVEVMASVSKY